jgi:hypothetical protein
MNKEVNSELKVTASKKLQKEVEQELKQKNKSIAEVLKNTKGSKNENP